MMKYHHCKRIKVFLKIEAFLVLLLKINICFELFNIQRHCTAMP